MPKRNCALPGRPLEQRERASEARSVEHLLCPRSIAVIGASARAGTVGHEIVRSLLQDDIREIKLLQEHLHDGLGQLVYDRTRRRPMILPVVVEV